MIHRGTINLPRVPYLVRWSHVGEAIVIEEATVFGVPLKDCPEHVRNEVMRLALAEIKGYAQDMRDNPWGDSAKVQSVSPAIEAIERTLHAFANQHVKR